MIEHNFKMGEKVTKVTITLPTGKSLLDLPCHVSISKGLHISKASRNKFTVNGIEYSQSTNSMFQKCLMTYKRSAFVRSDDDLTTTIEVAKELIKQDLVAQKHSLTNRLADVQKDLEMIDQDLIVTTR